MHEELEPLLRPPPKTKTALLQAIHACGEKLGIGPDWVQRWLSFILVADALARYRKGGAPIELRMRHLTPRADGKTAHDEGVRPRATKDLDATFRGEMVELQAAVGEF